MAVAIFVRGRALGLRRRAEPREGEGGAGTLTINELRVRIGQQAGRPPAGSAPWLPAGGVRAAPRRKRGWRPFAVGALRERRFLIPCRPGRPFGRVRSGGGLGGVKNAVQRTGGSPGVHRMRLEKRGVTGSARVAGGSETLGRALAAARPLTGVQRRGSERPPPAGGTTGSWMEGSRTQNRTRPSSSLGIQVALTNEFSYRKCIYNTSPLFPPSGVAQLVEYPPMN